MKSPIIHLKCHTCWCYSLKFRLFLNITTMSDHLVPENRHWFRKLVSHVFSTLAKATIDKPPKLQIWAKVGFSLSKKICIESRHLILLHSCPRHI